MEIFTGQAHTVELVTGLNYLEQQAITSLILDRYLKQDSDDPGTQVWHDVVHNRVLTIHDLLVLFTRGRQAMLNDSQDRRGRLRADGLGRWYIVNREAEGFAWSGSSWEPHAQGIGHDTAIASLPTREEAVEAAKEWGLMLDE